MWVSCWETNRWSRGDCFSRGMYREWDVHRSFEDHGGKEWEDHKETVPIEDSKGNCSSVGRVRIMWGKSQRIIQEDCLSRGFYGNVASIGHIHKFVSHKLIPKYTHLICHVAKHAGVLIYRSLLCPDDHSCVSSREESAAVTHCLLNTGW